MTPAEDAVALFKQGFNCSQAVLAAFAGRLGLDREAALKIAAGFGGGIGRMAATCGAVSGAVMVLGLRHGGVDAGNREAKEQLYALVREFTVQFQARHGATQCRDLLGYDLSTAEGAQQVKEQKLTATVCPEFVRTAAEIVEGML
ncbi:MAG: C_GCAxxG_C_C family protein [Verrucomicrobia bacterium]|nr:C_GCAxxG_C_C family protein [Verrucomicrobiota bacterium]